MKNATEWPDLAGKLTSVTTPSGDARPGHILPVRVYFEDTDFSGLVYHASYVRWCERGRSDFLRLLGVHHNELFAGRGGQPGVAFVVRRMQLDYLRPARIDEVLEVMTSVAGVTGAAIELDQMVSRDAATLFRARVQVVLMNSEGKPVRITREMRAPFEQVIAPTTTM